MNNGDEINGQNHPFFIQSFKNFLLFLPMQIPVHIEEIGTHSLGMELPGQFSHCFKIPLFTHNQIEIACSVGVCILDLFQVAAKARYENLVAGLGLGVVEKINHGYGVEAFDFIDHQIGKTPLHELRHLFWSHISLMGVIGCYLGVGSICYLYILYDKQGGIGLMEVKIRLRQKRKNVKSDPIEIFQRLQK